MCLLAALTRTGGGEINGSVKAADFFDFPDSLPFAEFFNPEAEPWAWVTAIKAALSQLEGSLPPDLPPGVSLAGPVHIDPSVQLPAWCTIVGPAWIGPDTEIRPGAYIRGHVIVGRGCVLGNACEFKNALLLDGVKVPHFSYVGDSVLGNRSHLGVRVLCQLPYHGQQQSLCRPQALLPG